MCQIYLAYFFFRSAYRKVLGYERVKAEFFAWGYPFPGQVTVFLIVIWIIGGTALLIPVSAGISALVLLAFMTVAFVTLLVHGEYRRLVEPARPIALLMIIVALRFYEIADTVY